MQRSRLLLALGLGGALILSACGDDTGDRNAATGSTGSEADAGQDHAGQAGSAGAPTSGTVAGAAGAPGAAQTRDPAAQAALGNQAATSTLSMTDTGTPHVTDGAGSAVYVLAGNTDGTKCDAACEDAWPPVLAVGSQPTAGQGLDAALLGTFDHNGRTHVTYGGEPLYRYAGDAGANRTAGAGVEDQWGKWSLVGLDGQPLDDPR